jgi:hypothetical protein
MSGTPTPIYPQTVKNWAGRLLPGTGAYTVPSTVTTATTNLVAVATGDTNGDKIESLIATSTDTAAQSLVVAIISAVDTEILGVVTIPITAGTIAGTPPVNLLSPSGNLAGCAFDANGNKYIYLPSGSTLYIGTLAAVTAAKSIQVYGSGGQF